MSITGRVALVTGANRGIGKGIAEKFASEGAKLALVDVNGDALAPVAKDLGAMAIVRDLSSNDGLEEAVNDAAATLGANVWWTWLTITLPLAWPGILAGSLLAFARAMGEFGASLMVAGSIPGKTQTLSMAIYDSVQAGEDDIALALVLVTSVLSVSVLGLSNWLLARKS